MLRKIDDTANSLKDMTNGFSPRIAVILGSGLGGYENGVNEKYTINYSQVEGFPRTSVSGHSGKMVFGEKYGKNVVIMCGRIHYYEGCPMFDLTLPVRVLIRMGVKYLIVTNAAGGINEKFNKGDIMLITNHISLFCPNPLIGKNIDEIGERFPDITFPYDEELNNYARQTAKKDRIDLKEGVYCYLTGPSYETAADIRALRAFGADSVGMSTVPEVIAAVHGGMRVCGISCISNKGAGMADEKLSHKDIVNSFENSREKVYRLLDGIISRIDN
jgi:purine-nucleoside phosphorylase